MPNETNGDDLRVYLARRKIILSNPSNNSETEYTVQELDGNGRKAYFDRQEKTFVTDATTKETSVKDYEGMQQSILALGLYKTTPQGEQRVPIAEIEKLPARFITIAYGELLRMSDLLAKDEPKSSAEAAPEAPEADPKND